MPVALRKESVDRNYRHIKEKCRARGSLSARRAWIEIGHPNAGMSCAAVALRKESVDRNNEALVFERGGAVALRKESVDRNQ